MTNDVKIFAKTIEQEATEQIEKLSHHPVSDGSKVRIMPDVHAGAGCTIGTTMTIHDRVCPNLVGVDIGCGMLAVKLGRVKIDLDELANSKCMEFGELLSEIEAIVYSGTKININYFINEVIDEDHQEDIFEYFKEADSDSLEDAIQELGSEYSEDEIRLMRIKFLSELGN